MSNPFLNLRRVAMAIAMKAVASLRWKLWGVVIGTVLLTLLLITWIANWLTQGEISDYVTREQRAVAATIAPLLADFYLKHEGWDALASPVGIGKPNPIALQERPPLAQVNREPMPLRLLIKPVLDRNRVVVSDEAGRVVADSMSEGIGTQLSDYEIAQGQPILVGAQVAGRVYVGLKASVESERLEMLFGERIQTILLGAGALAALAVLLLGGWFAAHLIRPIEAIRRSANRIAAGDLTTRIQLKRRDELGWLAEAMNRMSQQLESAHQLRRQLVADIAHELRTPLAVLQGNLEAMADGMIPLSKERISSIHAETLLLNRLVEDLRTLSLAEAGELSLRLEAIPLEVWVHSLVESLRPGFQERKVSLIAHTERGSNALADPQRLRQILLNLLSNALQHTPEDGQVTLTAKTSSGDNVFIQVRDTGAGIPEDELPHLFDRFYRGKHSGIRSGSTGLGLAIVKALVEAHGGQVIVQSAMNEGTTFTVALLAPQQD